MVNEQVSIVIAVDGRRDRLRTAVESVLQQTYGNWELIIVDDQQSPIVEPLEQLHQNIKVVLQPRRGIASARNAGIGGATGDYIAFLDADDSWLSTKLAMQVEVLRRAEHVALCYTNFQVDGCDLSAQMVPTKISDQSFNAEEMELQAGSVIIYKPRGQDRDVAALAFVEEQCIPTSTVIIRRSCLPYTGLFDPMFVNSASCDMWIKILRRFHAARITASMVTCLRHNANAKALLPGCIFDHAEIYRKYVQYGNANANRKLVNFASALMSNSARHIDRCHYLL